MSNEEESVDDGVDELMEELGVKDVAEDVIKDPDKEESSGISEADLAQKALDESSDDPAESAESEEDRVPLSKYMGVKNKARDLEIENAGLRGRQIERDSVRSESHTAVATKSPLRVEMETQGVDSIDDLDLTTGQTFKLMKAEQDFESKQVEDAATVTTAAELKTAQTESCGVAIETYSDEGLEFMAIVKEGENLLTPGEGLDLSRSKESYGDEAYKKCVAAIIRQGGERAEQIQKLIDAKNSNQPSEEELKAEKAKEEAAAKAKEEAAAKAKAAASNGKFDLEKSLNSDDESGGEADLTPSKRLTEFMKT